MEESHMAKIMTINSGSSSLKFKLYEMPEEKVLCSGIAERIGLPDGIFTIKYGDKKDVTTPVIPNHAVAAKLLLDSLVEKKIISCVGIPDERFAEDALRILRALPDSIFLRGSCRISCQ